MNRYIAFLKAFERNSFSDAARDLGYTQSAVSQMIKSLEAELGETYPNLQFLGAETVGAAASIGLPAGSVAAVIVVLVLALVYLAVRGGAMAGVAALIALVHDLLVMLALTVIFSFFGGSYVSFMR